MTHGSRAPAGNGSQWPLMAAELLQSSLAFRESMHACAKALAPYGLDLLAEMIDPEGWKSSAASASGLASVQVQRCALDCNARLPYSLYQKPLNAHLLSDCEPRHEGCCTA